MTLLVAHPPGRLPERRYALGVVLEELLGLPCETVEDDVADVVISDSASSGKLVVSDVFFRRWLGGAGGEALLPELPLAAADLGREQILRAARTVEPTLPLLYAAGEGELAVSRGEDVVLRLDVFGSAFFMLTRLEEILLPDRDPHGRFPVAASAAARGGFLHRPLVSEYVEVLWAAMNRLWPRLERRRRRFRIVPTHDVDWPLCMRKSASLVARDAAGDVVRRGELALALRRLRAWPRTRRGDLDADVCNTFDFIMDSSEANGVASAFYFHASGPGPAPYGCEYALDESWIRALLARIARRGHEIGLHGSYDGYRDPVATRRELDALVEACASVGVDTAQPGGRQHFLRWENPVTWRSWDEAGLAYDSTVGYAEAPGFRAGVCHEYPVFDLERRRQLALRERPLVVMDGSLTDYLELHGREAAARLAGLRDACRRLDGDFVVLWHNSRLLSRRERRLYRGVFDDA